MARLPIADSICIIACMKGIRIPAPVIYLASSSQGITGPSRSPHPTILVVDASRSSRAHASANYMVVVLINLASSALLLGAGKMVTLGKSMCRGDLGCRAKLT